MFLGTRAVRFFYRVFFPVIVRWCPFDPYYKQCKKKMLGYRSNLISLKCVGVENALWCKEKLGCRNLKSEPEYDDNALFFYLNVAKLIISTFLENIVCKSFPFALIVYRWWMWKVAKCMAITCEIPSIMTFFKNAILQQKLLWRMKSFIANLT